MPNHLVEQFRNEYLRLYPQARVLAAGMGDVTRLSGATFFDRIANNARLQARHRPGHEDRLSALIAR